MGLRAFIDGMFHPRASVMIEKYLETGDSQSIVNLFDGGVELDAETYGRLMEIHEKYLRKGDGMFDAFFHPEARDDLVALAKHLKAIGK